MENIISNKVVKALNLKSVKHPRPYKISWIQKRMDIQVLEICNVTFSIGNIFIYVVLCDVIYMDVWHLVLGRSWQYAIGTIYNGRTNCYNFIWKGRKLQLLPFSIKEDTRGKKVAANVKRVTESGFTHCIPKSGKLVSCGSE